MTTSDVLVELTENVDRIAVYFPYNANDVEQIKRIKGRRWDPDERYWHVPMDLRNARRLREIFGERMRLGAAMKAWAKEQVKIERNLRSLGNANDAELFHTPKAILDVIAGRPFEHPSVPPKHALRKERPERSYQRADIRMMAISNAINANDVGTGKTIEVVGAIYEGEIHPKPILVIAPRRTLVNTWQTEFNRFSDYQVWASESPAMREAYMNHIACDLYPDQRDGNVVCLIADDVRITQYMTIKERDEHIAKYGKAPKQSELHARVDYKGNWYEYRSHTQKDFFSVKWGAVIIDEFHGVGLPNRNSLFSLSVSMIEAQRRWPMSGTPIGGKPRRLWPILNYIDPKKYTSEWNWIEEFLETTEEQVFVRGGGRRPRTVRHVGGIADEAKFNEAHRLHMIRRTKRDALPGLPDAVEIIVPTPMSGTQLKDYKQFDDDHEIVKNGKRLSGSIILSQYKRLRQMANSVVTHEPGAKDKVKWVATSDSCKLDYLKEMLDENGVRRTDWEPGARAYIGVLDLGFMWVINQMLTAMGIENDVLHGGTKDSKPLIDRFNSDSERPYVIVMTIQTGGTGLNLERAGSAHAMDEEWDPDVMTQFFGRGDRGARETPLKCYTYRTPDSIQEYVAQVAGQKVLNNKSILNYLKDIEALRRGEES